MIAAPQRLLTSRGHKVSIFVARTYVVLWSCSLCDAYRDQIRDFVQRFYQFVEGVSQHHRNVDELLSKVSDSLFTSIIRWISLQSLDTILSEYISDSYRGNLTKTSTLSQVAQIITNLEHFEVASAELERSLTALRCALFPVYIHPRSFPNKLTQPTP